MEAVPSKKVQDEKQMSVPLSSVTPRKKWGGRSERKALGGGGNMNIKPTPNPG